MAYMITRPVASATELISPTTFLWGHTGSSPAADRRFSINSIVTRDGSNVTTLGVGGAAVKSGVGSAFVAGQGEIYTAVGAIGIGTTGPSPLIFYTNSTEAARIDDNRNFGVGTNAPDSKLHVIAGSVASLRIGFAGISINYLDADNNVFRTFAGSEVFRTVSSGIRPGADNNKALGEAAFRWSVVYAGSGAINTSDRRFKKDISDIPDKYLDAWTDVSWRRFKMIDGERWHVGLVAQEVHAAFAAHDLDAFEIGLCCYDEWEEQREPIYETITKTRNAMREEQVSAGKNERGEQIFKLVTVEFEEEYHETVDTGRFDVKPAGNRWGLRYDECQSIEAAWQRREIQRLAARLTALETGSS